MTLEEAISKTKTMAEAAELFGKPFTTFKRLAIKAGLYTPNQGGKGTEKSSASKIPLVDILKGHYPTYQTGKLKKRLIEEGLKENCCECCGLGLMWNGKPITLELDHINGISTDHREENLRLLCPNCHSQTDTFRGRNIKR